MGKIWIEKTVRASSPPSPTVKGLRGATPAAQQHMSDAGVAGVAAGEVPGCRREDHMAA